MSGRNLKRLAMGLAGVLAVAPAAYAAVTDADIARERGNLLAFYSDPTNVGIDLDTLVRIKAEIADGQYDRECTAAEHDPNTWHMVVDPVKKCHYNHHHGDDPNVLNTTCAERPDGSQVCFGAPGEWYGQPGKSISYPWQTFMFPSTNTNPYITPEEAQAQMNGMENQMKHEGYTWVVRRNQRCPAGTICTTDFRVQFHASAPGHDGPVRYHSISFESRICRDPKNPKTCGIARNGGWADTGIAVTPPYDGFFDCAEDDSPQIRLTANQLNLANEQQFDPILPIGDPNRFMNQPPGVDDRFRCHNVLTPAQVQTHIRNGEPRALAQWWIRDPDRFQLRFLDPAGNLVETTPGSKQFVMHFYCEEDPATGKAKDPNCRMNGSKFNGAVEYIFGVTEAIRYDWNLGSTDANGDGRTDVTRAKGIYTDRWGNGKKNCTVGLDCIPYVLDNIEKNAFPGDDGVFKEGGYDHYVCDTCPILDHDLTPPGRSSWINWFYRLGDHNHTPPSSDPTPTPTPIPAPTLKIEAPTAGQAINGGTVNVAYTIGGDKAQVHHIHLQLDGNAEVRDDDMDGKYAFMNVPAGSHLVKAYLADASHATLPGTAVQVSFTTTASTPPPTTAPPAPAPAPTGVITGFTLINADTEQPVAGFNPIPAGAVINLRTVGRNLNIRANVSGSSRGLLLVMDAGNVRFDTAAPHAVFGEKGGNYGAAGALRVLGAHKVKAFSIGQSGADMVLNGEASVSFTIVNP